MCKYIQEIFLRGEICKEENETLLCLIPKVPYPETMAQFCPLTLCNVLSKLVMKLLANQLKPLILKLTGEHQTSIVPGCQAVDNVIIAEEIIHTMQKRKGIKGGMVLKVDLEKAYDRVEWSFLKEVLLAVGFSTHLVGLILSCISSTSHQFSGMVNDCRIFNLKEDYGKEILSPHTYLYFVWRCWDKGPPEL